MRDYGISAYDAGVLVGDRELADYYEELANGIGRESRQSTGSTTRFSDA